ncbi:hypothetical protein ACLKA7_000118, partial [Drosophila subpalustris]
MKLDNVLFETEGDAFPMDLVFTGLRLGYPAFEASTEGSRLGFIDPVLDDVLKAEAGETERRGVEADFGLSTDLKEPFVSEYVRVPDGIEEGEERRAVLAVGT